jgi:autotransporter-associated beta strand protein
MPVYAGTVWDGGGVTTNVNTANNWDDNVNPAFDGTQAVTFGTGGTSATINANVSFLGLTFNRDNNFTVAAGAGNLTIGAGGINAAIPNATSRTYTISEGVVLGNDQTWTATNSGSGTATLIISGGISGVGRNLTVGGTGNMGISGVIGTGTGSLTKTGTDVLTLSGANTYTGATAVDGGTLSVNGSITSPVTVNSAGILGGSGTITGNITNSGTIAPGSGIDTLTITGNYTHNAGAVYQVEVNNAGQSDRLAISGTATFNGGAVSVLAGSGTYATSTNYTILTAGTVSGAFGSVTSNLAFLAPSLSYDPTNVYLMLTRNSTS